MIRKILGAGIQLIREISNTSKVIADIFTISIQIIYLLSSLHKIDIIKHYMSCMIHTTRPNKQDDKQCIKSGQQSGTNRREKGGNNSKLYT